MYALRKIIIHNTFTSFLQSWLIVRWLDKDSEWMTRVEADLWFLICLLVVSEAFC